MQNHQLTQEALETINEIAKNCNQELNRPPPSPTYKQKKILLIRHGFSQYNYKWDIFKQQNQGQSTHNEKAKLVRLDPHNIDTHLHEIGEIQSKQQQKYFNELNIHSVLVSPLFRALQTADILFQNHPRKNEIKFLVVPELSEGLCFSCSIAPFAFSEKRKQQFQNFDFSFGEKFQNKILWQVEQLQCDQIFQKLQKELQNIQNEDEFSAKVVEELQKVYPQYLETHDHLWLRAQKAKQFIQCYLNQVPEGQQIVIVAHYVLILYLTSSENKGYHNMDGIKCQNASIKYWDI
ncbi:hypothetical protein IMG5_019880 [Ichthyophthirius multifiliis]|uniref:Phosphoglycerate mutase family protein n=1 Tax=Ichthyophthirius multifiliis TaxID=5932 RepID=G0QKM5_ICHMU|nr:hypothetical protein IMG5_019880 [Ichthyophthirius multifiliis]EGR34223.1 hypothetical protein IMG5_019880 [Ichthyophthirius multifiliis]|eukprot:XP_004039527.1 hypothetical protein IMG5_019880 [Ichthyophthirius multifiliis]